MSALYHACLATYNRSRAHGDHVRICLLVLQGADEGADAAEYVKRMRQQNKLIMGIGHRIKSLSNPDMRVTIIKDYALKHFKNTKVLDFAMAVEQVGRLDGRFAYCSVSGFA